MLYYRSEQLNPSDENFRTRGNVGVLTAARNAAVLHAGRAVRDLAILSARVAVILLLALDDKV